MYEYVYNQFIEKLFSIYNLYDEVESIAPIPYSTGFTHTLFMFRAVYN